MIYPGRGAVLASAAIAPATLLIGVLVPAYWFAGLALLAFLLILLATTMTVTTPVDEVMDAVARGLRPLRRVGVDPEAVALAFSLMLRAIPTTMGLAEESRDAAVARGLERSPRARLIPFVVRVVARAHDTGDALHARGIGDD